MCSALLGFVTKHAYITRTDGRTDIIMIPKTALAQLRRAVKGIGESNADNFL